MTDVVVPKYRNREKPMRKAEFDRDMWLLKAYRDKYDNPGLNTFEGNDVDKLLEKYDIEYTAWVRREMFK